MNHLDKNAKKSLGQNFLRDKNIINKIVNVFNIENEKILEIGPGQGDLTKELLKKAKKVLAFEIDKSLIEHLKNEIKDLHFELRDQDFLNVNLNDDEFKDYYVVANIPYYITSDILLKIYRSFWNFKGIVLMVQKEVAQRIVAQKNSKNYSKLSISSQYLADVKIEFIVNKNSFIPAPKVDSAVISLKFKDNIDKENLKKMLKFFLVCFSNRRKKLTFTLNRNFNSAKVKLAYEKLNLSDNARIQELDVSQIVLLFTYLN